ncbi:unnamed protein product [Ectocarpus sp. 12 AP-2014]
MVVARVVGTALLLLVWRVWVIIPRRWRQRPAQQRAQSPQQKTSTSSSAGRPGRKVNTLVVLGSGGHTSEMLKLTSRLSPETYSPLCYVVASTDHTSADRIPKEGLMSGRCRVHTIPRSREVGQSYLTSVFTTLLAGLHAAVVVVTVRPDLVLVNGPGEVTPWADVRTCIPVCVAASALRFFGLGSSCSRTVFCESFCRVKSLSLSGRIMYLLADRFVVHWPELLVKYPRAEYAGQLM